MTFSITKLTRIAISTLAIFPLTLTLNLNSLRASAFEIDTITRLSVAIVRNPLQINSADDDTEEDTNGETPSGDREQSTQLLLVGLKAEQAGKKSFALSKYRAAIQADPSNGHAYMALGHLLIDTDTDTDLGIKCLKFALERFKAENDIDCYKLAYKLLKAAIAN